MRWLATLALLGCATPSPSTNTAVTRGAPTSGPLLPVDRASAITGFVAYGSGELVGHAVDGDGSPLRGVEIHVVSHSGGEQIVHADGDGNYRVELQGAGTEESMIFVRGHLGAHLGGQTAVPTTVEGGEAIEIRETLPPAVAAKPVSSRLAIPEYSPKAIADDAWTRTWLMLDVDESGVVRRLKLLERPGHDLDAIAIRAGFNLRFEPARDRSMKAIPSVIMWTFEWPAYTWLVAQHQGTAVMPADYMKVHCRAPGERAPADRDCSNADVARSLSEDWLSLSPRP